LKKILIARFSSIGDVVITSAVVRNVRKAFPEAEIHFATKKEFFDLIAHNPNIDVPRLLGTEWEPYLSTFKAEEFDLYIDLHKNIRTRLIYRASKSNRYITYNKKNLWKWLLVHFKVNKLNGYSVNTSYFDGLTSIGIMYDGLGLDFFIGDTAEEQNALAMGEFVAVALGGQYATKQAPREKLDYVLERIEKPVVLLGGKAEKELADFLASKYDKVSSMVGKTSLLESAIYIRHAGKVLSNDTGMMHIAAAMQKDMAVLWGSSVKEFGFSPIYPNHSQALVEHFEQPTLKCRPCSKLGKSSCPKTHFKCMNDHNYDRVAEFLNQ